MGLLLEISSWVYTDRIRWAEILSPLGIEPAPHSVVTAIKF